MTGIYLSYIYFVYGLAFFTMGLAVLLEVGRTSEIRLARSLPWLAAFGLIHGGHEWVEMFETLGCLSPRLPLGPFRLVVLVVSFACLAAFGFSVNRPENAPRRVAMWQTLALIGICLGGMITLRFWLPQDDWLIAASVWVRYSLGIVGASIASWALVTQGRLFARQGMERFGRDLAWAAVAFALYGVIGQLFVTPSRLPPSNIINSDLFLRLSGVPIQLFRAAMAVAVAAAIIPALRVFESERSQRLQAAQTVALEAERRIQRDTFQLNKQLQEAVNELSILYEMSRILASTLNWQALLHQAVIKVTDLLPARAAMIVLDTPTSATVGASAGFRSEGTEGQWMKAFAAGRDAITAHANKLDVHAEDNLLAVPLHAKHGQIGSLVISAENVRAFESKQSLLLTLGHELGAAIENVQLYQRIQEREELRGDLLRKSVEVQEEERKRIARELHDGIGQIFTALALGLSGVEETLPRDPALANKQIGHLKGMAIRAIAEMRQLVADLRPPQLDDLGLVPALHWLADEWRERLRLDVHVQVTGPRRRLTPEMETVLFRVAQEGLTNIAKHARAQHAEIELTFGTRLIELRIEDNGIGMTPEQITRYLPPSQGWGLAGIRERAALVGGSVDIDSSPGHGTRLTIHIPLNEQETTS